MTVCIYSLTGKKNEPANSNGILNDNLTRFSRYSKKRSNGLISIKLTEEFASLKCCIDIYRIDAVCHENFL